jgi:squalene synthase HpnC
MSDTVLPPGPMPAEAARIAALSAAQAGAENFPVALKFLPRGPRAHLASAYAYARFVDDVGDLAGGDRLALLRYIDDDVHRLYSAAANPVLPTVAGLRSLRDDCGVPPEPFLDLITANRIDQNVRAYETFDDLLDYCRYSAAPVGRIVLHIAAAAGADNVRDSDQVCAALQVLEHCQDVGEDAAAGRLYLPAADLRAADVDPGALTAGWTSPALRTVVAAQVERAHALLASGRPLVRRLSGWARVAVSGYVAGGLATVDALRASDFDVLAGHVAPSKARTVVHALRLVAGK